MVNTLLMSIHIEYIAIISRNESIKWIVYFILWSPSRFKKLKTSTYTNSFSTYFATLLAKNNAVNNFFFVLFELIIVIINY